MYSGILAVSQLSMKPEHHRDIASRMGVSLSTGYPDEVVYM